MSQVRATTKDGIIDYCCDRFQHENSSLPDEISGDL